MDLTETYPYVAWGSFNGTWVNIKDAAVGGSTTVDVQNRLTADKATLNTYADKKVYSLMIGTNDIRNPNNTADATIYANIQATCNSIVTAIPTATVIVFTILPSSYTTSSGTFESHRQAVNTLIRNGGTCPYVVADTGSDPTIGLVGQNVAPYYQGDGVHLTALGESLIASTYLRPALVALGY